MHLAEKVCENLLQLQRRITERRTQLVTLDGEQHPDSPADHPENPHAPPITASWRKKKRGRRPEIHLRALSLSLSSTAGYRESPLPILEPAVIVPETTSVAPVWFPEASLSATTFRLVLKGAMLIRNPISCVPKNLKGAMSAAGAQTPPPVLAVTVPPIGVPLRRCPPRPLLHPPLRLS